MLNNYAALDSLLKGSFNFEAKSFIIKTLKSKYGGRSLSHIDLIEDKVVELFSGNE